MTLNIRVVFSLALFVWAAGGLGASSPKAAEPEGLWILFSGYTTYHVKYYVTATPVPDPLVASERFELTLADGVNPLEVIDTGSASLLKGTKDVWIASPGATVTFSIRQRIEYTSGEVDYVTWYTEGALSKKVRGKPAFDCLIEGPDPANLTVLDFGTEVTLDTGISLTIKNAKAENTEDTWHEPVYVSSFGLGSETDLVVENCEFMGFSASSKGSLKMTNCHFTGITYDTRCLVSGLAGVEVERCLFEGSADFGGTRVSTTPLTGALTIANSLFYSAYEQPYFHSTGAIGVTNCEFYGKGSGDCVSVTPMGGASFSECVFKSVYLEIEKNGGAVRGDHCYFWGDGGINSYGATGKTPMVSCYWGNDTGPTGSTGWVTPYAAFAGTSLVDVQTPLAMAQAKEKVCSRTEPRPLPNIWIRAKRLGQNTLIEDPIDSQTYAYLARQGRDVMFAFDARCDAAALTGVTFRLDWNGTSSVLPTNPGLTLRRDYGVYNVGSEGRQNPDARTVNFIAPASLTETADRLTIRLFADLSGLSGYASTGSEQELTAFYMSLQPAFKRKLRVLLVPVIARNLDLWWVGNTQIHPTAMAEMRQILEETFPAMTPLRQEDIEYVESPAITLYGVASVIPLGLIDSSIYNYVKSTFNVANSHMKTKPFDYVIGVVPAAALGATQAFTNGAGDNTIIVRQNALLASIHEMGHTFGLYNNKEQYAYDPTTPFDAYNNWLTFINLGNGAYESSAPVQNVSVFKPQTAFPVYQFGFSRRYQHYAYRTAQMFDIMGTSVGNYQLGRSWLLDAWPVPATLKKFYAGLYAVLDKAPPAVKPLDADKNRVLFYGLAQNSTLSGDSILCREASELPNVIANGSAALNAALITLDSAGTELSKENCVTTDTSRQEFWTQSFDVPKTATKYELRTVSDDKLIFSLTSAGDTIRNELTVEPKTAVSGDSLRLAWAATATPKNGRAATDAVVTLLRHQLYLSTNQGVDWTPLSDLLLADGEFEIPIAFVPPCADLWIKLVSSDGFASTENIVKNIVVAARPPLVQIVSPTAGNRAPVGTSWSLQAIASDAEDGLLKTGEWTSSLDGKLGDGLSLSAVVLSAGDHTIAFTAKDSSGLTTTKEVAVTVGDMSQIDLTIPEDALTFRLGGVGPTEGGQPCPQIGKSNRAILTVRNQGVANQAKAVVYIAVPGEAERTLMEADIDWDAFASFSLDTGFAADTPGTYTFRATLERVDLTDSDSANNERTWTFTNGSPIVSGFKVAALGPDGVSFRLQGCDPEGCPLTYAIVEAPLQGTLDIAGDIATYKPKNILFTSDTFTYKANDGTFDSDSARVTILNQIADPQPSYHSADYNPADWRIDIFELLRVVQLFNDGLYYEVDATGPDGFNPSPVPVIFAPGTYHSADYNPADGQIDVFELFRVIQLFNDGLYYKVDATGPDGYAPSPTPPE